MREEALEYVRRLASVVGLAADQVVLDFGGGLGFVAETLAPMVGAVWWWDPSPAMQAAALRRLAPVPNARLAPALAVTAAPAAPLRFDLILVNSVVQYMTARELGAWLGVWRRLLRPAGRIVLSDLVRRATSSPGTSSTSSPSASVADSSAGPSSPAWPRSGRFAG